MTTAIAHKNNGSTVSKAETYHARMVELIAADHTVIDACKIVGDEFSVAHTTIQNAYYKIQRQLARGSDTGDTLAGEIAGHIEALNAASAFLRKLGNQMSKMEARDRELAEVREAIVGAFGKSR